MTLNRLSRRAVFSLVLALAASLAGATPPRARASIFGEENATLGAILSENIAQLQQMVSTVTRLTQQVEQMHRMIQQGDTVLSRASDLRGLSNLLSYMQNTIRTVNRIDGDIKRLRFQLETIDNDRKQVFPTLGDVPNRDFRAKARVWNDSLRESSAVAMRAQTSVETLEQRVGRSEQLLRQTEDASGIVGQLQVVVRSLALLHADLNAIETNLAAGQRVTATMAAVQAAEADRNEQVQKRLLDGYTDRGGPPKLLQELP